MTINACRNLVIARYFSITALKQHIYVNLSRLTIFHFIILKLIYICSNLLMRTSQLHYKILFWTRQCFCTQGAITPWRKICFLMNLSMPLMGLVYYIVHNRNTLLVLRWEMQAKENWTKWCRKICWRSDSYFVHKVQDEFGTTPRASNISIIYGLENYQLKFQMQ